MDFRIIPESLPDDVKTEYLLRDMPINEVVQIAREALSRVDYGTRNTYKIELWVRNEYDKQGNIDYLRHIINRGKLWYSDILKAFKLYNPFFESDPSRPIDWLDTMMREKKKEEVFLTDDFEYVPQSTKPVKISNPRWEHKDEQKSEDTPDTAAFSDTIILKADLENYIESGSVTFDIYDTSVKPPRKVGSANGRHSKNIGKAEWVVTDKNGNNLDAALEFEASAKSKTTSRCKIPLHVDPDEEITFKINCVDLDGNPYAEADFEIINVDKSRSGIKTSADGTLEITVKKKDASKVSIVHVPATPEESEETESDQTEENPTDVELSEDEISEDDAEVIVDDSSDDRIFTGDSSERTTGKSRIYLSEKVTTG